MNRDVPFDSNALCDVCGRQGAFDFMGDFICEHCASPEQKTTLWEEILWEKIPRRWQRRINDYQYEETRLRAQLYWQDLDSMWDRADHYLENGNRGERKLAQDIKRAIAWILAEIAAIQERDRICKR